MNHISKVNTTLQKRKKILRKDFGAQISQSEYQIIMSKIDTLIEIPDTLLSKEQANELHQLAAIAQQYEKSIFKIGSVG